MMETQKQYLQRHFIAGYSPSDEELEEMKNKLILKNRLPEVFWRMNIK